MNEDIEKFLDGYLVNSDPQYAVFLKGNWGCGKTFFINKWLESYKKKIPADQVLEPVMVSLYGLSEIKQVKDALNRVLCPILYGKVAKTGKALLKLASSFVLKHEVDLNNDGASDFEMNVNIDPMSIFISDDDSVKKGKLLIFDDIERCEVPMYEIGEESGELEFCHNPFSMPQGGMDALNNQDPLEILAYQYDLVCNGVELSSGAVRNHDPEIMIKAFELVGLGEADVKAKFPAMYNAFCYGAPPHAGIAPGVDRMIMLICGEESIREIIPFPMNKNAMDIMMGAPGTVEQKQLDELHLAITAKPEE